MQATTITKMPVAGECFLKCGFTVQNLNAADRNPAFPGWVPIWYYRKYFCLILGFLWVSPNNTLDRVTAITFKFHEDEARGREVNGQGVCTFDADLGSQETTFLLYPLLEEKGMAIFLYQSGHFLIIQPDDLIKAPPANIILLGIKAQLKTWIDIVM